MKQETPKLASALQGLTPRKRGPRCTVATMLDEIRQQDPKGHELLAGLIDDPTVTGASLAEALVSAGYVIQKNTILRHRHRGTGRGCSCPK
jgi:hypothetical protein